MTFTHVLAREQFIPRPIEEVFEFFAEAGNLEVITPEFLNFRIVTPRPIDMAAGALIDYRLRLFGLPLRWRTRIEAFEPCSRFVDVQARGPYRLWRHTHEFRAASDGTLMTDRVEYQIAFGPIGGLAHAIFVRRTLNRIFDHRARVIERIFPSPPAKAGVVTS